MNGRPTGGGRHEQNGGFAHGACVKHLKNGKGLPVGRPSLPTVPVNA